MNKRGIIFKGIGGFYYVHVISDDGKSLKREIYCCKARGILKKQGITPCVGDVVEVDVIDGKEGVIEKIEKRKWKIKNDRNKKRSKKTSFYSFVFSCYFLLNVF